MSRTTKGSTAEQKGKGRRFGFRPLWFLSALAILGSAGAATGVVLTGNVSGLITATASQSLLVRDVFITGADAQLGTVSDEMTRFTASAEMNTGDEFDVHLVLGNESDEDLVGELQLVYPEAMTVSLNGQNDAACEAQLGPFTWSFTLLPNVSNPNDDLIVTVALRDDAPPGFYSVDATLKQINRSGLCFAADDYAITEENTPIVVDVLANDTDFRGDGLTIIGITEPAHGTVTLNPDGTVTYFPDPGFFGRDRFEYEVENGSGELNTAVVTVDVVDVNVAPIAVDDDLSTVGDATTTPEDTPITIDVLANDVDEDGDDLAIAHLTAPSNGTVHINPDQTVTYTPAPNFNGTDSFTYQAFDGELTSSSATVTVIVTPVNDHPAALDDSATTDEDTAVTIDVLANDSDVEGMPLIVTNLTQPAHGSASVNPSGTVEYTPDPDFNGTDTFTYTANDGNANSAPATVTVIVNAENDAPIGVDDTLATIGDAARTPEDTPIVIDVLANDIDVDGDALMVTNLTQPPHGTTIVLPNQTVKYLPDPNFHGVDTFTYTANDGAGDSNITTVTVTVTPVNDTPIALSDAAITDEDVPVTIVVLANDSDADGDPLSVLTVSQPSHGTASVNGNQTVTYTPNANFHGTDTFTYRATDGSAPSNTATVTITVKAVNDAPSATDDSLASIGDAAKTLEDTPITVNVLANDLDVDGDPLMVTNLTQPAHGTASVKPNQTVLYTPDPNYNGLDTFTYTANDGTIDSNPATVTITVVPVNDPPVALNDTALTLEDVAVTVSVLANDSDVDGDVLSVSTFSQPAHGVTVVNPNHTITYTPEANFNGIDTFTYVATDGIATSNIATVTISLDSTNDAPIAVNDNIATVGDAARTPEDTPITIDVLANDTDPDGDNLSIGNLTQPANGTVVVNPNDTVTYTPDPDFNGIDNFTYTANDGAIDSAPAIVTVTVVPVNDAPVALNDAKATNEDVAVVINVLGNDVDVDGDVLSVLSHTQPSHGVVTLNPNRTITYTPDPNFHGVDTFTYIATDSLLSSNTAMVTITLNAINDAPSAHDDNGAALGDAAKTLEDTPITVDVLANDIDVDGDVLMVSNLTQPAHGTVVVNANQTVTYAPDPNFNGFDHFTYTAHDGSVDSNIATVTIEVIPVNDAPIALDDLAVTNEDTAVTISVLTNDIDVDGDALTVVSITQPSHGTAVLNPNGTVTYTPDPDFCAPDEFTYIVTDGALNSNVAHVRINVKAVNDAPVAINDDAVTKEGTPVTIDVLANDYDIDSSGRGIAQITPASHGTLVVNPNQTVTYTPSPYFSGLDSFTYRASDGAAQSNSATVTIEVKGGTVFVMDTHQDAVFEYGLVGAPVVGLHSLAYDAGYVRGITTHGSRFWVVDEKNARVYVYDTSFDFLSMWDLHSENEKAEGITTNGQFIWVVNAGSKDAERAVYKYTMAGGYVAHWSLHQSNDDPTGVAVDATGQRFWVIDHSDKRVYTYGPTGALISDWPLTPNTGNPQGIHFDGDSVWILNRTNLEVERYTPDGALLYRFALVHPNNYGYGITVIR